MASNSRRLPENYQFVYELLKRHAAGTHLSPGEILIEVRRSRPRFGYATLYRALARLRDLGLISEVAIAGAEAAAYEPAAPDHAHFRCTGCGRIDDVPFTLAPSTVREIAERQHVDVIGVTLTFNGICADCRKLPALRSQGEP